MPSIDRPGKTPKYIEFPAGLAGRLQAFADARGETFTAHVIQAVERHLAYPPPTVQPLPDATPAKKARARKK